MSFVQPSRSMFLKTSRFSRGCGAQHFWQRGVGAIQLQKLGCVLRLRAFFQAIIDHRDRRRSAGREAFHELDAVLAIGADGDGVSVLRAGMPPLLPRLQIDSRGLRDLLLQFVAAGHGAGERPANPDVALVPRDGGGTWDRTSPVPGY